CARTYYGNYYFDYW
nr:immunoglobulin heavy chain junction region [Mus musculus]MBK4184845.1 immunoglobulin heavy chain junction region [Mus musculus]